MKARRMNLERVNMNKMHKPAGVIAARGYLDVLHWQRCRIEPEEQCSPAPSHDGVGELASGTHGKPRGKGVVNLVINDRRNVAEYAGAKRQVGRGGCFFVILPLFVARPGDSASLKVLMNVMRWELGKPDGFHVGMVVSMPRGNEMVQRVEDAGESECRFVMKRIGRSRLVTKSSAMKVGRLPAGLDEGHVRATLEQEGTLGNA